MKFLLHIILFIIVSNYALAGVSVFSLKGTVVDSTDGTPVELATVALKKTASENTLSAINTDVNGKFNFDKIPQGKYEVVASFMGYVTKITAVELKGNVIMKPIKLASSIYTMSAATVVAEKSLVVKTAEKTVYNVAESPINQTGTLEDILRNLPGVSIDQNGNISITGKDGVNVLVDGRPNALASSDLPAFLKSIPASSIESIEVITNPSAKYDAEGNAGIINIKLKKGKADGLNGNASAGYGILNHYNGSANVNYRKNKINVFGNYSLNYSKNKSENTGRRTSVANDTLTHYNSSSQSVYSGVSNNLKTGFDYFIDNRNTLTYTIGGNERKSWTSGNSVATSLDSSENLISMDNSTTNALRNNYSVNNSLNYQEKFDSTDRELDVYLSYSYVSSLNYADMNTLEYDSTGNPITGSSGQQPTVTYNTVHSAVFQLDYVHPLKRLKGYKIETGGKDVLTVNKTDFTAYQYVNKVKETDTLLSNNFNYTENVAAIYGLLRGSWSKWLTYSAGLRTEDALIESNTSGVSKNYLDFFPNVNLGTTITDNQRLSFSYSRRIQRPSFNLINNAITYIDPYTQSQGNPYLRPSYSEVLSMNYNINVKKQYFSLDADGNFQTGGFYTSYTVDSSNITHQVTVNGRAHNSFNLSFYSHFHLTSWWEFQMNHHYSYNYYAYSPGLNTSSFAGSNYSFWSNMDFKFWKNMTLELGAWAVTQRVQVQGIQGPIGVMWASIKKSFLNDKLTASIAAQDIFQTIKSTSVTSSPGYYSANTWQYFDRCLTLSLRYRFGGYNQEKEKKEKEKEENERIDSGQGG